MELKYDIHQAINFRSHRKGLASDFLRFFRFVQNGMCSISELKCSTHPSNTYGIYYPGIYGKKHSFYKKK